MGLGHSGLDPALGFAAGGLFLCVWCWWERVHNSPLCNSTAVCVRVHVGLVLSTTWFTASLHVVTPGATCRKHLHLLNYTHNFLRSTLGLRYDTINGSGIILYKTVLDNCTGYTRMAEI